MTLYDGNRSDTSDFSSDNWLRVNSCGIQNLPTGHTVIRRIGRSDYHLLLVGSGCYEVMYGGQSHKLSAGNLVVYEPHKPQQYTACSGGISMWCHFTGTAAKQLLDGCGIGGGVYVLPPNRLISESYAEMIRRFHLPGHEKYADISLTELLYRIGDVYCGRSEPKEAGMLAPVIAYIHMNYDKPLTLEQLSGRSGYSKSRFSHLFAQAYGTTPMKYLNRIRLQASRELLACDSMSIGDAAERCGFRDPLYYSRLFCKVYHMTPSAYRQSLRQTLSDV